MTKRTIIRRISDFISSDKGQRFFIFAYSIGAAVVIWGAWFKILHLQGGNTLLSIGMGTEVLMFTLSAFEAFDKKSKSSDSQDPDAEPLEEAPAKSVPAHSSSDATVTMPAATVSTTPVITGDPEYLCATPEVAAEMTHLAETTRELNRVHDTLLESYKAITDNASSITGSSTGYVEQMQTLNRNIAALNAIYEIQLRSVSGQLEAVDSVNRGMKEIRDLFENNAKESSRYCEEAEKMTRNMQRLNQIYEKMLTAMTIMAVNPVSSSSEDNKSDR